ncbi:C1D-domain-containing protein, partial [Rhizopogon salebrosus TDB-379]
MASDEDRLQAKVANLNASLDELETQLDPLFAKSLPETLVGLETIQQAKLQVALPYVLYDLVFVYLKTRGIDPRNHPVISELDRVRQYFDKIKSAEDSEERKRHVIDKAAAGRFIKHAIAQAKLIKPVEESSSNAVPALDSNSEHVPVKITSKMAARAEYERKLKELGSEEEDDLEVFNEAEASPDEDAMEQDEAPSPQDKGKSRMMESEDPERGDQRDSGRKRPRIDPFAGYGEDNSKTPSQSEPNKQKKKSSASALPVADSDSAAQTPDQSGRSTPLSTAEEKQQRKAAKKARRKEKK